MLDKKSISEYFSFIKFDEDHHKYYIDSGETFISATTLIGKYKRSIFNESFKKEFAERRSLPDKDYVNKLWSIKSQYGALKGTELHFYIESFLNHGIRNSTVCGIKTEIEQFHSFWDSWGSKVNLIGTEILVGDSEFKVAGTLDALVEKDGNYYILDWKTNKNFSEESESQFADPIRHLNTSDFNSYSLQLSIYKYILEKYLGINIPQLVVVWLTRNNEQYKIIPLENKQEDVLKLFQENNKCGK